MKFKLLEKREENSRESRNHAVLRFDPKPRMAGTIYKLFPSRPNVLSNAKRFHCSCHATWLPCKIYTPLFAFQPIITSVVHKIIKSLSSNKDPGCDKVNAKILKDSSPVIAPTIISVMNNSFTLSNFSTFMGESRNRSNF